MKSSMNQSVSHSRIVFVGILTALCVGVFALMPIQSAHAQAIEPNRAELLAEIQQLQQLIILLQSMLVEQQKQENITNPENPIVSLDTNMGVIEIELFSDVMPITAGNFLKLSEENYYDGVQFHRVIEGFMIQGGDPITKTDDESRYGIGGPGYAIPDEHVVDSRLTNVRGTLSMANSGPNSGGSQFFINLVDNKNLDFDKAPLSSQHPVFGKVIAGMDVVDQIGSLETNVRSLPIQRVVIENIEIETAE